MSRGHCQERASVIGVYLGHSSLSSAYGAAGSLVVILVWVYYSAQILLFGVELTKCWKASRRPVVVPEPHAENACEREREARRLASALRSLSRRDLANGR